jgi:glyoxylase-like metal-dependent hydrolase (beta-lactamase superfamily II)
MSLAAVSLETLRGWLEEGKPVTVLDVRPAAQQSEWNIPGSLHVDAYEALKAHDPDALSEIELPFDRPVVTVCGMGRVSAVAAQQLRDRGYEALSLDGGMKAWSLAWNTAEVGLRNNSPRVIQVRRTGKGCLSYLVGSKNEAATIDASLPPDIYLNIATKLGWRITNVLETHIHADHLSRSRQLALLTGAVLHLPPQERVTYSFSPFLDGQCVKFGEARLKALLTPGHTAESTCYLLNNEALFTGDTLFLAGVGRPDLEATPEDARLRAEKLYASLQKILRLPAETLVLPGHVSRPVPFDGIPVCARLDEVNERITNLRFSVSDFVSWVLDRVLPTPPNHRQIIQLNEQGLWPEGDPTDLEAGANRCAVS